MTATAAPVATMSAYDEAKAAWNRANWQERKHAEKCWRLARGQRCDTCLQYEAAQNVAALQMEQARLLAGRVA